MIDYNAKTIKALGSAKAKRIAGLRVALTEIKLYLDKYNYGLVRDTVELMAVLIYELEEITREEHENN